MPDHSPALTTRLLPSPANSTTTGGTPDAAIGPADVPGYVIGDEIGRGGMGRVYAGVELALGREVAIKTLLPGGNPERFVTEAALTARLAHPGIPPVYALGTTADGRPFLAMKRIRGRTLADLLKARANVADDLPRFVQIFEQVAQAVAFAHARGVVHRDLKPSNVMVGEFGEVQVMDWGLAMEVDVGEPTISSAAGIPTAHAPASLTATGTVLGTPGYMPPEQARGEPLGPAADVFALGAVLAEVLSGRPAFTGANTQEVLFRTAAGDLSDVLERLAACQVDADLVALAIRYLTENSDRRPPTAGTVATEVRAYRTRVEDRLRRAETDAREAAVRDGERRKRQRVLFAAGGAVAAALLVGLGVSLWQTARVSEERDTKDKALTAESEAKVTAERKQQEAERNLGYAQKSNALLGSVFSALDPNQEYPSNAGIRDALRASVRQAARELPESGIGDPLAVAQMMHTLGCSLHGLGEDGVAAGLLEKAIATRFARLGEDHPDTIASTNTLGMIYLTLHLPAKAHPLFETTLRGIEGRLGPDDPDRLTILNHLASAYKGVGKFQDAVKLSEEVTTRRKTILGPKHRDTLVSKHDLASILNAAGKRQEALTLWEETLDEMVRELGEDNPNTLLCMLNIAEVYEALGRRQAALTAYEGTAFAMREHLGVDHPHTLDCYHRLAHLYKAARKFDDALPLFEKVVKATKERLGELDQLTLVRMNDLAECYRQAGQISKATPIFEEAVRLWSDKGDHPNRFICLNNLALAQRDAGHPEKAIPLLEEALNGLKGTFGIGHPFTRTCLGNVGDVSCRTGDGPKAAAAFTELVDATRTLFPPDHLDWPDLLTPLGQDLLKCDQFAVAETMLRESLAIREKKEPDTWTTFNTQSLLGAALLGQKKYADAEPLLVKGFEGMKARAKSIPEGVRAERITASLDALVKLFEATNKPEEAKKYRELRAEYPAAGGKPKR